MQINPQKQRLDKQDTVIKEFEKASNIGEEEVRVLFDTGASRTFIRNGIAKKSAVLVKLTRPRIAILGDGENKIKITESIFLEISLDDYVMSTDADISDKLAHELIIGASMMQE